MYKPKRVCCKCSAAQLMETVLTFFIAGFFTAFGWWAAGKVTIKIDTHYEEKQDDIRSTND